MFYALEKLFVSVAASHRLNPAVIALRAESARLREIIKRLRGYVKDLRRQHRREVEARDEHWQEVASGLRGVIAERDAAILDLQTANRELQATVAADDAERKILAAVIARDLGRVQAETAVYAQKEALALGGSGQGVG